MEKLGLIIKITDAGEQEHSSINKESKWAKHASDARIYIKDLEGFDGTSKTTTFVKFIGTVGYLICLVKANPKNSGRPLDNTAAWIYIPSDLDITGETLSQILESVDGVISDPTEIKTDKLEDIFSKLYTKKDLQGSVLRQLSSKETGEISVRFYGDNTDCKLNNLLGNNIAQIDYNGCRALLLIDNSSGIIPITNKVKILKGPIKKICTILPPRNNDDGFIPNVKTKEGTIEFSKPIEVTEGTSFNITWNKKGYKDVIKPYTASFDDNDNHPSGVDLTKKDYYLLIPQSRFRIMDSKNRSIDKYTISINGTPLISPETALPEYWFQKEVKVTIEREEYEPYSKEHSKVSQNTPITITLHRITYHYELDIPIFNQEKEELDKPAKITFETNHKINNSPIPGYKLNRLPFPTKGANHLEGSLRYDKNINKKLKKEFYIKGFVTCFLACLIIVSGIIFWREKNNYRLKRSWFPIERVDTQNKKSTGVDDSPVITTETSLSIEYLDKNNEWEKDSLENYYNGLYEDIIDFKFENLRDKWSSKLSESLNFKELINVITNAKNSNQDLSEKDNKDIYMDDNTTINLKKYIEWIKDNTKDKSEEVEDNKNNTAQEKP